MDDSKCKVLIISYDYYPDTSPNTYRWQHILQEWSKSGHQIFVVSAQKPGFSEYETFGEICIYRTGKSWLDSLKAKLPKTVLVNPLNVREDQRQITKDSFFKKIYNLTFKKLYFPDFAFLWYAPAKRLAAHLIKEHDIKNVITVSWPFTDHRIGYYLKSRFDINWIADTIDPFYLSDAVNNTFLYKKANWRLENKLLSKADYVTVLTHKLKEKYLELYPSLANKVVVNHNIFIPYAITHTDTQSHDKIKLAFFGTLTPKTRSPKVLLKLMEAIDKLNTDVQIELHVYGDTSQCDYEFNKYQQLLDRLVFLYGLISKEEVKQQSQQANILVNIGNSNEYQEPSKIVEYIYLSKPVLNICTINNDSSRELLDQYPLNLNFFAEDIDDDEKISSVIKFIVDSKIDNTLSSSKSLIENYLLPTVQSTYLALLKKY